MDVFDEGLFKGSLHLPVDLIECVFSALSQQSHGRHLVRDSASLGAMVCGKIRFPSRCIYIIVYVCTCCDHICINQPYGAKVEF